MKNWFKKRLKNEKGLTLVELLAVIVILGIIAAIAVPAIGNIITNSKVNALKADGQNVLAAANLYFVENGTNDGEVVNISDLKEEGFLEDAGGFSKEGTESGSVKKLSSGNTITATATNGDISVEFKEATNKDINSAGTKQDEDTPSTITITRGK